MNSKLLIFVFLFIGLQSTIKTDSDFIEIKGIKNLNGQTEDRIENINLKELKFFVDNKVEIGGITLPELECNKTTRFNKCEKYGAKFVKCFNLNFKEKATYPEWQCEFKNPPVSNKNIKFQRTLIGCKKYTEKFIEKPCILKYFLEPNREFDLRDDVTNGPRE